MIPAMRAHIFRSAAGAITALALLTSCGGGDGPDADTSTARKASASRSAQPVAAPVLTAAWSELPNAGVATPAGPGGRAWTEMTWDPVRAEIVLFGGNGPNLYDNDIWSYKTETGSWTLLDPHTHCPGNDGYSKPNGTDDTNFKYDPVNHLYWAFGAASGYRCIGLGPTRTAGAGTGPTTIVDPTLASGVDGYYTEWFINNADGTAKVSGYNAGTRTLTLATPLASLTTGSTYRLYATSGAGIWYFDPSTQVWVGQNTPPGNTGPIPTQARIAPAVDYSVSDEAFALWGGLSMGSDRSVWKLDVRTKKWTQLPVPAGGAPAHRRELLNSFVYDKANDVFILFGGICSYAFDAACPEGTVNGQTWAYRLSTNTWVNMSPTTAPTPRAQHLMAYDDEHGVVVLFGGGAGGSETNDTWVYHYPSNTWTPLAPASAPAPRRLGQIAYNPVTRQTIIFGGATTGVGQRSDIWALKLTGAAPPNTPPSVSLTSPAPGTTYTAPATIALAASASDTDGSVAKVEFYAGATKIGEDSTAPYALNWSSVPAGSYSLTAVATDNAGATSTSTTVNVTVNPGGGTSINVAAQANGGVSSASSTYSGAYPVTAVNDGSRLGNRWGQGGGWNDATASTYPDWVQVTFAGTRSIDRIDVFTLPDNYAAGIAPTPSTTFGLYGITDFTVQYWTGAAWATVPGGTVTANNLVWRSFSFPAVSTDRIRITVSKSLYWYSRIVEVEAWSSDGAPPNTPPSVSLTSPAPGTTYTAPATIALAASASDTDGSVAKVEFYAGATKIGEDSTAPYALNWSSVPAGSYSLTAVATDNAGATSTSTTVNVTVNPGGGTSINVAAQANGGVSSASSTYSGAYPVTAVNDGSRLGNRWGQGGGWNDATASTYPDWVQVTFAGTRSIDRIDVFTLPDNYAAGIAPTPSTTFGLYGITDFTVQYWTGAAWATVPGGTVTANNLVWRSFSFPAVSTDRIRITVSKSLYWYSRIVEIEAWSTP